MTDLNCIYDWSSDSDTLEDQEKTTQVLLNKLGNEPDHVAEQVLFWHVVVDVGNVRKNRRTLNWDPSMSPMLHVHAWSQIYPNKSG